MDYKKGERIRHPQKEEWGVGELLRDSQDEKIRVFFTEAGEKILSLKYMTPVRMDGDKAKSAVLDNLITSVQSDRQIYKNITTLITNFLNTYPNGFDDNDYIKKEREFKITAHYNALKLLNDEDINTLLQKSEYETVCQRALQVIGGTKLISPNEKALLRGALGAEIEQKQFAEGIYQLLYGTAEFERRFLDFATVLRKIGSPKWTIISYLLFVMFPEKYMVVKPKITEKAAEVSGFEIHYVSDLSWLTYASVQKYAQFLATQLSNLHPKDMVDIQSFIWSIA